jgi:hypothetical protein
MNIEMRGTFGRTRPLLVKSDVASELIEIAGLLFMLMIFARIFAILADIDLKILRTIC